MIKIKYYFLKLIVINWNFFFFQFQMIDINYYSIEKYWPAITIVGIWHRFAVRLSAEQKAPLAIRISAIKWFILCWSYTSLNFTSQWRQNYHKKPTTTTKKKGKKRKKSTETSQNEKRPFPFPLSHNNSWPFEFKLCTFNHLIWSSLSSSSSFSTGGQSTVTITAN